MNYGIIGHLRPRELKALTEEFKYVHFDNVTSSGFDPDFYNEKDRLEAIKRGVTSRNYRAILKRNNFTKFNNLKLDAGIKIYNSRFRRVAVEHFCYQGFYACIHNDAHVKTEEQIMFVVRNSGHRLYSTDFRIIAPKSGDIIRLNTHRNHGVFPSRDMTPKQCEKNPFEFYAVAYSLWLAIP